MPIAPLYQMTSRTKAPLPVLWSEPSTVCPTAANVTERAVEVRGPAIPTGRFLPEQVPGELLEEIEAFVRA